MCRVVARGHSRAAARVLKESIGNELLLSSEAQASRNIWQNLPSMMSGDLA
jgi:hypothetical protein